MRRISPIIALMGLLVVSAIARGQGPNPKVPKGVSGYTVTIQDDWVDGHQGFFPMRVTIQTNPAANVVNDTLFTVSVHRQVYQNSPGVVSAPLIIPAGKKSGAVELYVYLGNSGNVYGFEILIESGEYDGELNRQDLLKTSSSARDYYGLEPALLFVSRSFTQTAERSWVCYREKMLDAGSTKMAFVTNDPIPRLDELRMLYQQSNQTPNTGVRTRTTTPPAMVIANSERIHGIHPDYLPKCWIGLSSVDQILISMSDFKSICLKQNADRARIEQWVVAGGALIVFDTGPGFQEADKIWPFLLGSGRAPAAERELSEWIVADSETKALKQLIPRLSVNNPYYYYDQNQSIWIGSDGREAVEIENDVDQWQKYSKPSLIPTADRPVNQNNAITAAANDTHKFGISSYVNGHIIAINDDLSTWNSDDWRGLQNALVSTGGDMRTQIGASTGTIEMPGFAIPGVGSVAWLESRDGVDVLQSAQKSIQVSCAPNLEFHADLLAAMIQAGIRVASFEGKQKSLEDVFLSVTRGHIQ